MPSSLISLYRRSTRRMFIFFAAASFTLTAVVWAQEPVGEPTGKAQRKQTLEKQLKSILNELDQLKQDDQPATVSPAPAEPAPSEIVENPSRKARRRKFHLRT